MTNNADVGSEDKKIGDAITTIGERLKYIYCGTIKELSLEGAFPFWIHVYNTHFKEKISVKQFFDALWSGTIEPPFYTVFSILNQLEFYLIEHRVDPVQFVQNALPSLSNGLIISSERVLLLSNSYLADFFDSKDLHGTILKVFSNLALSSEIQRETCHRLLHHKIEGDHGIAIMIYHFFGQPPDSQRFPAYDFELWTGSQIQSVVSFFNIPAFDELNMLADYRLISEITPDCEIDFKNGQLFLDGQYYAKEVRLYQKLAEYQTELLEAGIPDCTVLLAEKNYYCPLRKRTVIHEGCVYGAPLFLYQLIYNHKFERPANFLSLVISALQEQRSERWQLLKEKHDLLVLKALRKLEVVYDCQNESISINGVHFISGVPAKILKKLLSMYCRTKRVEFQYREFTKDPFIVNDPLNPNFVVRLNRLTKALENGYPELQIQRIAPGRLRLEVSCPIKYYEK
ncbi:MAG: hypothetical protein GX267_11870 [Fibrobacter sp.]|jgi:hypothetical protein|nr:hypothetical protein [Fibrobacter sp.]